MSETLRVVLVGHCTADAMYLTRFVRKHLPTAAIERANAEDELDAVIGQPALLLVNRVLDGRFDNSSGMDVLQRAQNGPATAMLISNYEEAQQAAVEAGTPAGFGKSQLGDPASAERLIAGARLVQPTAL